MKKRTSFIVLAALLLALLMAGCGLDASESSPVNLAVICCRRANNPAFSVSSTALTDAILTSTTSYGSVCLIANDGAPYVAAYYHINKPDKNLSPSKRAEIAKQQLAQILSVLDTTSAKTAETDTLAAITFAARSLSEQSGAKTLLVIDSGLSTCGYIDFTKNLLYADSQTVVDYLTEQKALPDLAGVSVLWVGLGDVVYPQEKLTADTVESLRVIWRDVLTASGAENVSFSAELPGTVLPDDTLPFVTPVHIFHTDPLEITYSPSKNSAEMLEQPVILSEETVLFLPDSTELADPASAAETLRPIADCLIENPDVRILLAGTTATVGSNDSCKKFSLSRAETIKRLLIDMGVPSGQIAAVIGLGYDHEFHIPDIGVDGSLNENAKANRSVILLNASSAEAQALIANYF